MLEKLEEADLEFMELFHTPQCMAECLFSNYDNLTDMTETDLAHIRLGQLPLISYEWLIDNNPELSEKENFNLRKGAGEVFCLGGRLFGKTLFVEKIDLLLTFAISENDRIGFTSYDAIHIRGVLEDVLNVLAFHPFYQIYEPKATKSPNYRVSLLNGNTMESVNMNIHGKSPGKQFFQKHFSRLYEEEASFETEEIYNQRRDSVSENGCIFRVSGMTNFTKYSPCGRVFYDLHKRTWVLNLPQYINPKWDDNSRTQAIKDFGGEQSLGYRVFIKGEIVEEGVSLFDMERVRKNYNEDRKVKNFEINKESFPYFKDVIYIERPPNCHMCYVYADIGESAPSEIGIIFEVNKVLKYVYNITAYNLTDKEQFKLFRWLGEELRANFIALDCTDGTGRAIFRSLAEVFPKENLVWVNFSEKLPVDFEKDDKGHVIFKNGQPVFKEEFAQEWSVKHLKELLYAERFEIPIDYKFDSQFNSVIAMQSGTRTIYECVASENHLFQAFQVFSVAHWYHEFSIVKSIQKKAYFKSGV